MFKNLTHLYYLLICFITMMVVFITSAMLMNQAINVAFMEQKFSDSFEQFYDNESYISSIKDDDRRNVLMNMSSEELNLKRLDALARTRLRIVNQSIEHALNVGVWWFCGGIFFIIHMVLYRKYIRQECTCGKNSSASSQNP